MSGDVKPSAPGKSSFAQTMKAVAWSFFGVRKGSDHAASPLDPVHVVIAGVIGAALFIGALLLLVNWVLASGAAR